MKDGRNKPEDRDEWMTPDWVLQLARLSMRGEIDLDPCSTQEANRRVHAAKFFTKQDNSLVLSWKGHGNLFINPPYSRGLIDQFVAKTLDEWRARSFDQAVMLTNNATETSWCQQLFLYSTAIFFPWRRINFVGVDGSIVKGNRQGQILWFFGHHSRFFREACQNSGVVVERSSSIEGHPLH